mgnify:CR=1 FL=1
MKISNRILACAFTCCAPGTKDFRGGEDFLGWNLLQQIAQHHEIWAITNGNDQRSLEQGFQNPNIHYCYVTLPRWLHFLTRIQGGIQIYYHIWQVRAYFKARHLHKQLKFDLFHHITYANDWLANFIGAFLEVPYVRGPGGGAHSTPKRLMSEYPLKGRIWEKIRSVGQRVLRLDPIFIKGQSRAKAILLCNKEAIANIPNRWTHKVHAFPVSGILPKDFEGLEPKNKHSDQFQILTAGSLIRVKGFGLAIKSFKEFVVNHSEARFTIVGSGPEESRLKSLVHDLNLESNIEFLGSLPREHLLRLMSNSDVFLFPSLRDGGGTVVVEAMAAGIPVVCLDTGGPGMHITKDCGISVAPDHPNSTVHNLASALEDLYVDPSLRLRLGYGGQKRAAQLYHWERLGDQLMAIYQQALEPACHDYP